RHIGPSASDTLTMLEIVGVTDLDQLIDETLPASIRIAEPLDLPAALSETAYQKKIKTIADKNRVFKSFIGQGYYGTVLPGVIQRNVFENPGWYTQYTPYQAEIAQGRLQALLNFQTMVIDLTGMEIANASLLDEATAAAEAMFMQYGLRKQKAANKYLVSDNVFPQTLDVLQTRARSYGIEIIIGDITTAPVDEFTFGVLVQYPAADGSISDYRSVSAQI